MKKIEYHVLNGDSLKAQFPNQFSGEIIVARECLVDGPVDGRGLDEFFQNRAAFIVQSYGANYSLDDYYQDSVAEFEKIRNIPGESVVNLWFEDDLFCQVNFWFVSFLIHHYVRSAEIYLVRPETLDQFGFGGLDQSELMDRYDKRIQLHRIPAIASLWKFYQNNETDALLEAAADLQEDYPFVQRAAEAHAARLPTQDSPGRPVLILKEIMESLGNDEFGPVFREFNKRAYVYGFGDLQVKRLFDQISNTS